MSMIEGWNTGRLGELCSIEIGGTPSRNVPDYWDDSRESGNHWVSIRDLSKRVITETAEQITDSGIKHSNVKRQGRGTVLLSFKLTIGRVAYAGVPLYTNEAIAGLTSEDLDHDFLFQGLQQWDLLQGVDQAIKGATLNKEKLKRIEFDYPATKSEQAKIAEMLSTVDRAIEQTEKLITKQLRIKTGLMQDLLTKGIDEHGNLRSEATHTFKDSPLGRIPVEWAVTELKDVSEFVTSGSRGWARYYSDEGAIFLRIGNLTRKHINLRLDDLVCVAPPNSSEGKRTEVKAGDLLISITADLGVIGVVPDDFVEAYVNQHISLVRLTDVVDSRFVGWYLSGNQGRTQFEKLNESGAKAGLNLPTVCKLIIPMMDMKEQRECSALLDSCASGEAKLHENLDKLRSLKTALMQDLLTGKKRILPLLETRN